MRRSGTCGGSLGFAACCCGGSSDCCRCCCDCCSGFATASCCCCGCFSCGCCSALARFLLGRLGFVRLAPIPLHRSIVIIVIVGIGLIDVAPVRPRIGGGCQHAERQRAERKSDGGGDEPLAHVISWVFAVAGTTDRAQASACSGGAGGVAARTATCSADARTGPSARPSPDRSRGSRAPGSPVAPTGIDHWRRLSGRRMWRELGRIFVPGAGAPAPHTGPRAMAMVRRIATA